MLGTVLTLALLAGVSTLARSPSVSSPEQPRRVSDEKGTVQIVYQGPTGISIAWDASGPLTCPTRRNFAPATSYAIKLSNVSGYPGLELRSTMEVSPATPRTERFTAHNSIPVPFTPRDLDQACGGNSVTKVIYLPDQEPLPYSPETLVSTLLDSGTDPVAEANRRGAILAIVRIAPRTVDATADRLGSSDPCTTKNGRLAQFRGHHRLRSARSRH
jgi:hypothetical protein